MPIFRKSLKGYTLIEMVTAIGVFAIILMAISQIFGTSFKTYREAKLLQRQLENAQFALNAMAKELRTSSIVNFSTVANAGGFSVTFFDYSQDACIQYIASAATGKLTKTARLNSAGTPDTRRDDCESVGVIGGTSLGEVVSSGITNASINTSYTYKSLPITTPGGGRVGRITFSLTFGSIRPATIQTIVSLRDFNYIGI